MIVRCAVNRGRLLTITLEGRVDVNENVEHDPCRSQRMLLFVKRVDYQRWLDPRAGKAGRIRTQTSRWRAKCRAAVSC